MFPTCYVALWIRLASRKNFSISLDEQAKTFIWRLVCKNDAVDMFLLVDPRPQLIDYNRYDNLDPDLEIICEPVKVKCLMHYKHN